MSQLKIVSPSPHIYSKERTSTIMWWVSFALLPLVITSTWVFGLRSLVIILTAVGASVVSEYVISKYILKKQVLISDGSAVVTGILLAANLPVSIPVYQVVIGAIVAIGVGKMVFGGIGNNPFNPALVGRTFLLISFPVQMNTFPAPGFSLWSSSADAVSSATPLGIAAAGGTMSDLPGYMDIFLGQVGGTLGGIGVLAVLIGGLILIAKKIIDWQMPALFLGGIVLVTGSAWLIDPQAYLSPLFHIMAGGAMLGAFFMVTDYSTSPMTLKGKMIFAGSAGIITAVIRLFAALPDGVAYSILVMNALVPLIDRACRPKAFGRFSQEKANV
ncbi:MAG: RnfABCDGE type electron transport complex subunit D [Spirochaetaceae bacterium]|nr:MAG: RnfABCDGE type electron transport complex subunit D [Spirochaetaceae bacterium]